MGDIRSKSEIFRIYPDFNRCLTALLLSCVADQDR